MNVVTSRRAARELAYLEGWIGSQHDAARQLRAIVGNFSIGSLAVIEKRKLERAMHAANPTLATDATVLANTRMSAQIERLLEKLHRKPAANAAAIQKFEQDAGLRLPSEYVQFLQLSDGGEGFIGTSYVMLWGVGELLELNRGYQVSEFAPGLLLFGSDGGGEAFAFDMRSETKPIVSVPFVGMGLNHLRPLGPTFTAFLSGGAIRIDG